MSRIPQIGSPLQMLNAVKARWEAASPRAKAVVATFGAGAAAVSTLVSYDHFSAPSSAYGLPPTVPKLAPTLFEQVVQKVPYAETVVDMVASTPPGAALLLGAALVGGLSIGRAVLARNQRKAELQKKLDAEQDAKLRAQLFGLKPSEMTEEINALINELFSLGAVNKVHNKDRSSYEYEIGGVGDHRYSGLTYYNGYRSRTITKSTILNFYHESGPVSDHSMKRRERSPETLPSLLKELIRLLRYQQKYRWQSDTEKSFYFDLCTDPDATTWLKRVNDRIKALELAMTPGNVTAKLNSDPMHFFKKEP